MTTFRVDDVKKNTSPLPPSDSEQVLTHIFRTKPESYSRPPAHLNTVQPGWFGDNKFVAAVHMAFGKHYPLVLSPDMLWQCIAQGFAVHVNKNAEKLRGSFVAHEGKKEITIVRRDFVKGSADNDWEGVLEEFSAQIRRHVGEKTHNILTPRFSTTGPTERAAAQIVLMSTFKEYFDYGVTDCGIPEITLEGTTEDWEKLREKALSLSQFELQWWTDALKPILDEFVAASRGEVNRKFWKSIYKEKNESGGPYITGWILALFPYLGQSSDVEHMRQNTFLSSWSSPERFTGKA